jgi:glycosyltransferase involved in cell wall biosynthesis
VTAPRVLSPARLRSGFHIGQPVADLGLLTALTATQRRQPFDAVLAHNAEAALVALGARALTGVPVVYVAHTLWEEELASYLSPRFEAPARRAGAALDRWLGVRADAVLALSEAARLRLGQGRHDEIACIAPGLASEPIPEDEEIREVCARHELGRDAFVLYPGNLDGYQNLPLLDRAAQHFRAGPVVAVTHDRRGPRLPHLRVVEAGLAEARALLFAARIVVVPRRARGGFPIKILQAMEAERPIVALRGIADTLQHDESAWLLPAAVDGRSLAQVLEALWRDPARRARLGAGAAQVLAKQHRWQDVAAATLELTRRARARR